jgi:hypothetical protein
VAYGDSTLASLAADVAKDATAWLRQNDPERPALTASFYAPVVSRSLMLGLPDRGATTSSPPPASSSVVPDVRGLILKDARARLSAAGIRVSHKYVDDVTRKPMEVVDQTKMAEGSRFVTLLVAASGTVMLHYRASDAPVAIRFARDLGSSVNGIGVMVRLVPEPAVSRELVGTVAAGRMMPREALTIATFASSWLTKELGRTVSFGTAASDKLDPRRLTVGLPPLQ